MRGPGQTRRWCTMVPTDRDDVRATKADEELLFFDVSDDVLERAAPIIGGVASVVTLNFATAIIGNCGCPVWCPAVKPFETRKDRGERGRWPLATAASQRAAPSRTYKQKMKKAIWAGAAVLIFSSSAGCVMAATAMSNWSQWIK